MSESKDIQLKPREIGWIFVTLMVMSLAIFSLGLLIGKELQKVQDQKVKSITSPVITGKDDGPQN